MTQTFLILRGRSSGTQNFQCPPHGVVVREDSAVSINDRCFLNSIPTRAVQYFYLLPFQRFFIFVAKGNGFTK